MSRESEIQTYRAIFAPPLRVPPHDTEAEELVLGALLRDMHGTEAPKVMAILSPDDFYGVANGTVYRTIARLATEGKPYDPMMVVREAERTSPQLSEDVRASVRDALNGADRSSNSTTYAYVVRDHAKRRQMLHVALEIEQQAYEDHDAEALVATAQRRMLSVAAPKADGETTSLEDSVSDVVSAIATNKRREVGIPTGLTALDAVSGGLKPGKLVVIGARTSVGKTALAHQIGCDVAMAGHPVVFVSLEMDDDELAVRYLSRETGIDLRRIDESKDLGDAEIQALDTVRRERAAGAPMWVRAPRSAKPSDLSAWFVAEVMRRKVRVFVIDYLGLLDVGGSAGRSANRSQEIGVATRALKSAAMQTGTTMIVLAQLNRGLESRDVKAPRLSDLRDSGDIEQDADGVWLMHYPHDHDKSKPRDVMEIHVAKNRGGPKGEVVRLKWEPACVRFSDHPVAEWRP